MGDRSAAGSRTHEKIFATGAGEPITVFAHGFGQGIAQTRPLASGVPGRKVFFRFRGHDGDGFRSDRGDGGRPQPDAVGDRRSGTVAARGWTYGDLADDLLAVADQVGASQALGVSMGAGALCRLLVDHPARFRRLVFFLPAALDTPRPGAGRHRLTGLLDAVACGDPARVTAEVAELEVPPDRRDTAAGRAHVRQRTADLLRAGLDGRLAHLLEDLPVPDRAELARVRAPALVIGCVGDQTHPVEVAQALASSLPAAQLHVYDQPAVLWRARADLRARIAGFLAQ